MIVMPVLNFSKNMKDFVLTLNQKNTGIKENINLMHLKGLMNLPTLIGKILM